MLILKLNDLVIFRDKYSMVYYAEFIRFLKKEKNHVLNEIIEIGETDNYRILLFKNNLILMDGITAETLYNEVEIVSIWRVNTKTKNYDLIYIFDTEKEKNGK